MPAPTPPKGLSSGAANFLKGNAKFAYGGGIGLAFLASDAKNILDADNKLKALLKTAKDFILIRVAMIGIFKGVSDVIKGLVRDTGSLDAALKRLTQVQQYARQFQTFTGSLDSAKKKIAELHQLSTRGVFRFEDLVEANKSLQVFTRGAYTSVEATKQIGEAALATGNSIQDTASAVGNFYDRLRSGGPVGSAAEQLRQMGLISGATAEQLTNMGESGADLTTTFSTLTDALEKTAKGVAGYKDELQGVTEEHEKAVAALKVAFGAPWTQADVQTTKNMADGMKSITPVVAQLSKQFAFLYNGASTLVSALFKWAAGNKVVQSSLLILGQAIMVVTVIAGVFGASVIGPLIGILLKFSEAAAALAFKLTYQLTSSFAAAGIAARGLQVILSTMLVGSTILMAVSFVTALVGAVVKANEEAGKAQKEFQDWEKALRDTTNAILEQAAAVTTLASKYEALHATINKLSGLQKEHTDLTKQKQNIDAQIETFRSLGRHNRPIPQELLNKKSMVEAKLAANERNQQILKQSREEQTARQPLHAQLIKQEADRRYFQEQQSKGAAQRDSEARRGAQIAADVENKKSVIVARRIDLEKQLSDEQEEFDAHPETADAKRAEHDKKTLDIQNQITAAKKEELKIGLQAPEFSAAFKEAKAEQLRQAKAPPEVIKEAEIQAQIATKREAEPPSPEELRQAKVEEFQVTTEMRGKAARSRGDVRGAEAAEDLSAAAQHFEQLLPSLGKDKAASVALQETQADITQQYQGAAHVVSSMQAVGGGGNASGVDPAMASARRREELQSRMVELLQILTGQETQQPTTPTFQQ